MRRSAPLKARKPLARRTPLKRTRMRRKAPRRLRGPKSQPAYLEAVRALPCAAPGSLGAILAWGLLDTGHAGRIHAHHAGRRPGVGMKADDSTVIAMCEKHHRAWHDATGVFAGWTKADRRAWADAAIDDTRRLVASSGAPGGEAREPQAKETER